MRIDGAVVLITGASEGIGAACARALRKHGARLALTARNAPKLAAVARPDGLAVPGDLMDAAERRRIVQSTLAHYGRIDVLINNAGVGLYAPASAAPMDSVRHMWELNFFALLEMTQLVVPSMREHRAGAIVNLGSIAGKVTLPWFTLYSATKFAVGSLTDGLRMELKRDGIQCMAVCPGYVRTEFQEHVLAGSAPESVRKSRLFAITAEECAEAIVRGLRRNARTVVTPRAGWLLIGMERLLPSLVDRQLERIYRR